MALKPRVVFVHRRTEYDEMLANVKGQGDPLGLVIVRTHKVDLFGVEVMSELRQIVAIMIQTGQ